MFFGSIVLEHIRDFFQVNLGRLIYHPKKKITQPAETGLLEEDPFWGELGLYSGALVVRF